ncbi:hypothetical protein SASPL_133393 [Salvia splendens]|uniref:Uncharacterized protein n=1 Tax=Salvia splendens TaxID=180675 RepID=A0A8X8X443_SALSN|nr:hypothetical protein SASPL_133393 [Salvia splendens]
MKISSSNEELRGEGGVRFGGVGGVVGDISKAELGDVRGGSWSDGVEDAVELPALARRRPLEDDFGGAWGGAVRRRCVGGEDWRLAVGEGEIVLEKEVGAWCGGSELDWFGEGGGGPKVMVPVGKMALDSDIVLLLGAL